MKSQIRTPLDLCKYLVKLQLAVVDLATLKVNKHQNEENLSQVIAEVSGKTSDPESHQPLSAAFPSCYAVQPKIHFIGQKSLSLRAQTSSGALV